MKQWRALYVSLYSYPIMAFTGNNRALTIKVGTTLLHKCLSLHGMAQLNVSLGDITDLFVSNHVTICSPCIEMYFKSIYMDFILDAQTTVIRQLLRQNRNCLPWRINCRVSFWHQPTSSLKKTTPFATFAMEGMQPKCLRCCTKDNMSEKLSCKIFNDYKILIK